MAKGTFAKAMPHAHSYQCARPLVNRRISFTLVS